MNPELAETAVAISTQLSNLDPKKQMQAIELVTAFMCCRMQSKEPALIMAAGFNKHVKQLIESHFEEEHEKTT